MVINIIDDLFKFCGYNYYLANYGNGNAETLWDNIVQVLLHTCTEFVDGVEHPICTTDFVYKLLITAAVLLHFEL